MLLVESPRHIPYRRVSTTSAFSMSTFKVNRAFAMWYSSRLPTKLACSIPTYSDPSIDLWRYVGAYVGKASHVQKLHCLSIHLAMSFK